MYVHPNVGNKVLIITFVSIMALGIGGFANILTYSAKTANMVFLTAFAACSFMLIYSGSADVIPMLFIIGSIFYLHKMFFSHHFAANTSLIKNKKDLEKTNLMLTDEKEKSYQLARIDSLTNIPNRLAFFEKLDEAILQKEISSDAGETVDGLAVMICDLNKFKPINDGYGHHAGDVVLKKFAQRLTNMAKEYGYVARLGGDEFAVILRFADNIDIQKYAKKLSDLMQGYTVFEDHKLNVLSSFGLSIYPLGGRETTSLIKNADYALYQAKRALDKSIIVFDKKCKAVMIEDIRASKFVGKGIQGSGFEIVLQPIVRYRNGDTKPVYYEQLSRWNDKQLGTEAPEKVLQKADEQNKSIELGQQLFEHSVIAIETLGENARLSYNVSAGQFSHPLFVSSLMSWLDKTGFNPSQLMIEISENAILADMTHTQNVINKLRDIGIMFAIDDFGKGNTSIGFLRGLRIDVIKVDKLLVHETRHDAKQLSILRHLGELFTELGIIGIVEGVENEIDLSLALSAGFEYLQGYYFAKPQTAKTFLPTVENPVKRIEKKIA